MAGSNADIRFWSRTIEMDQGVPKRELVANNRGDLIAR